jgi:hypothetical protein
MNKLSILFSLILGLLIWTGCGDASQEKQQEAPKQEAHTPPPGEGAVELNDGQRWQANPETTEGIENMRQMVMEFEPSENVEDYRKINQDLMTEFNMIFQNCTMTGEAHRQLHNYLVPMKDFFNMMESGNVERCRSALEELQVTLEQYDSYFTTEG